MHFMRLRKMVGIRFVGVNKRLAITPTQNYEASILTIGEPQFEIPY